MSTPNLTSEIERLHNEETAMATIRAHAFTVFHVIDGAIRDLDGHTFTDLVDAVYRAVENPDDHPSVEMISERLATHVIAGEVEQDGAHFTYDSRD